MCGISGFLNRDRQRPADEELLRRMTDIIAHRGPDGSGLFVQGPVALGHRRLSIIDLSANGAQGHVVQIVDPAEETFPFSGRVEFIDPEDGHSITVGRAEAWRDEYRARVERHRAEIRAETDRLGWSFIIHRTDRPASELLLALHTRMAASAAATGVNLRHADFHGSAA